MNLMSYTATLTGELQSIWDKLIYWEEWPTWDGGMEAVKFDGALRSGSVGQLKLKSGPSVRLVVTELTELKSYTDEFSLLGTRFIFVHLIEPSTDPQKSEIVRVTVHVTAEGLTAPLIGGVVKSKLEKELPTWIATFQKQYEKSTARSG